MLAIPIIFISKKNPIKDVPNNLKLTLFIRSIVGITGFTTMVYAAKFLPIFVV
jgi:hypothetical protein